MNNGIFITVEGYDAVGKSTQVALLVNRLKKETSRGVCQVREPGSLPECEQMRGILKSHKLCAMAELLLFNASRAQLVATLIVPALARGEVVVCDRFMHSTYAYQHFGNGIDYTTVDNIVRCAINGVVPDFTILLTVSDVQRLSRLKASRVAGDKYDYADDTYASRVINGYKKTLMSVSTSRYAVIDSEGTVDYVHGIIWDTVKNRVLAHAASPAGSAGSTI